LLDDKLASLLWLRGVSKPVAEGTAKGRLAVPKDMIGPKCSEILVAFHLADADVTSLVPLFRQLLSVELKQTAGGDASLTDEMVEHEDKMTSLIERGTQLRSQAAEVETQLRQALKVYGPLHPDVLALQRRKKELVARLQQLQNDSEAAIVAALASYVELLPYQRPTNSRMLAYRSQVLLPLDELAKVTKCSDWGNRVAVNETLRRLIEWQDGSLGEVSNSIGMRMVLIPAGEFKIGATEARITKPFHLGATEVTQGQWEAVMETRPWKGESNVKEGRDYPATYVSWEDAVEFCRKLSEKEVLKEAEQYRLPTEAEWEYACRAGTTTAYHFGDDTSRLGEYAWYEGNAYDIGEKYAHQVRQKKPNPWGLYDMHGNVWEWCAGLFNPASGLSRASRGCCYISDPYSCVAAYRDGSASSYRNSNRGFRLARTASHSPSR
jgi:formylglycine-generating enzyme required for sulfatase activity